MVENNSPNLAPSRGLLNSKVSMAQFDLIRMSPSDALKPYVENYWIIEWDLRGQPDYVQENLPHPSPHLVIDPSGTTGLFGVQTGRFTYTLSGAGRIFGTKFWPGALTAFLPGSMRALTDSMTDVSALTPHRAEELERRFLAQNSSADFGAQIEKILLARAPVLSHRALQARQIVEAIEKSQDMYAVQEAADMVELSVRALQRLFSDMLGVTPKWVIERYRMLDAVEALNAGGELRLTDLAHDLGYHDQAHFIRMFKNVTGNAPSHYQSE